MIPGVESAARPATQTDSPRDTQTYRAKQSNIG